MGREEGIYRWDLPAAQLWLLARGCGGVMHGRV